jgi:hypothetical protein
MGRLIRSLRNPQRSFLSLAFVFSALLGGCATWTPDRCEQFDRARTSTDYDTRYVYSAAETKHADTSFSHRRTRSPATAMWYTLRLNRATAGTCEHLFLIKDLYLKRSTEKLTLEELREFYTAQGQLIATKREDVTEQLTKSGYYIASVPLPIPRGAPTGTYRVVTHLIATPANGRGQTLATASSEFRVD